MTSDWIASNEFIYDNKDILDFQNVSSFFKYKENFMLEFMKNEGLLFRPFPAYKMFKEMIPYDLNPMQKKVEEIVVKADKDENPVTFMIIESECGTGKTEAALYAASVMGQGKCGIYMGFPTSVSAESIQGRVDSFLSGQDMYSPKIFSSKVYLKDSEEEKHFTDYSRQRMLYPSAVGTIDQVLTVARKVKYESIRCAGLTSKVLILDEIHAYDAYMAEIIKILLQLCKMYEIPVIMLSATLPNYIKELYMKEFIGNEKVDISSSHGNEKEDISGYPLITYICKNGDIKSEPVEMQTSKTIMKYRFEPILEDHIKIAHLACEKVKNGGCLCVILNTVKDSIHVYEEIKKELNRQYAVVDTLGMEPREEVDAEIILYHARKPDFDKYNDSEKILNRFGKKDKEKLRPKRAIVVGTQTLEQSIDVDFDYMITSICPIDMLIQREGRNKRHDDKYTIREGRDFSEECMCILIPEEKVSYERLPDSRVYEKCLLIETQNTLEKYLNKGIRFPDDIPNVVNDVYKSQDGAVIFKENEEMSDSLNRNLKSFNKCRQERRKFQICDFVKDGFVSNKNVVTRYEEYKQEKIAVIPKELINEISSGKEYDYLDIYKKYVVSVPGYINEKYKIQKVNLDLSKGGCFFKDVTFYQAGSCEADGKQLVLDAEYGLHEIMFSPHARECI